MPLYDYKCSDCGEIQERVFKVEGCPESVKCTQCGSYARKIISLGHGGVQCDSIIDVSWLPSALQVLQPDGERPLETRRQYKDYLIERGLQPAE